MGAVSLRSLLDGNEPWQYLDEVAKSVEELTAVPGNDRELSELAARCDAVGLRRSALLLRLAASELGPRDADAVVSVIIDRRGPALMEALEGALRELGRSLRGILDAVERLDNPVDRAIVLGILGEVLADSPTAERLAPSVLRELKRTSDTVRLDIIPPLMTAADERTRPRLSRQAKEVLSSIVAEDAPRRAATFLAAFPSASAAEMGDWLMREMAESDVSSRARWAAALGQALGPDSMVGFADSIVIDATSLPRKERCRTLFHLVEGLGDRAPQTAMEAAIDLVKDSRPDEAVTLLAHLARAPLSDAAFCRLMEGLVPRVLHELAELEDPWSRAEAVRSLLKLSSGCPRDTARTVLAAAIELPDPEHTAHVIKGARAHCTPRPDLLEAVAGTALEALVPAADIKALPRRLEVLRDLAASSQYVAGAVRDHLTPLLRELVRTCTDISDPWERATSLGILGDLVGPEIVGAELADRTDALLEMTESIQDPWLHMDALLALTKVLTSDQTEAAIVRTFDAVSDPARRAKALSKMRERSILEHLAERLLNERISTLLPPRDAPPELAGPTFASLLKATAGHQSTVKVLTEFDLQCPRISPIALPGWPPPDPGSGGPWSMLTAAGLSTPPPAGDVGAVARELLPPTSFADDLAARLLVEGETSSAHLVPEAAGIALLARTSAVSLADVLATVHKISAEVECSSITKLMGYLEHSLEVLEGRSAPAPCMFCPAAEGCETKEYRLILRSVPAICEAPTDERRDLLIDITNELASVDNPIPAVHLALDTIGRYANRELSQEGALIRLIDLLLFPPDCVRRMKVVLATAGTDRVLADARRTLALQDRVKGIAWARRAPGSEDLHALEGVLETVGIGAATTLARVRCLRRVLDAEARPLLIASLEAGRTDVYRALAQVALSPLPPVPRRQALGAVLDGPALAAIGRSRKALGSLDITRPLANAVVAPIPTTTGPTQAPVDTPQPLEVPEPVLVAEEDYAVRSGCSYLVIESKPGTSFRLLAYAHTLGKPTLCITRTNPEILRRRYGLTEDVAVRWLTDEQSIDNVTLSPSHIDTVQAIKRFVEDSPSSVVLLDGMEYLVGHNGFDSVFRAIQSLRDRVSMGDTSLIVTVSRFALGERELTLLQRELETLGHETSSEGR
ncbi:MAG: DUF835 domain-containing protein [Candidatus Undinarchaeales archaeon]|jgi:hypothetical protein|nr:DUF835 domain-containing protein [Candidatus Undinarchaeales archaeon]MDP7493120.1 DUF835 domain-containing protein [Candidatus Undinarchaeales archaeon]